MKDSENKDAYQIPLKAYLDALGMLYDDEVQNQRLIKFFNSIIYPSLANWLVGIHKAGIELEFLLQRLGPFGLRLFDKFNGEASPILQIAYETLDTLYFNKLIQLGIAMTKLFDAEAKVQNKTLDNEIIDNCILRIVQSKLDRDVDEIWINAFKHEINEAAFIDELLLEIKMQSEQMGVPIFK